MENQQTETQVTTVANSTPQQVVKTTKTAVEPPPIKQEPPQKVYQTKKAIFRTYQVIWYILGFIEVLLGFRVFLKMFAANAGSGFTNLIYTLTDPLALPFYGVFGISVSNGSVFEWSTFVAGAVYALIAYGIIQLLQIMKPTDPVEVTQNVDTQ